MCVIFGHSLCKKCLFFELKKAVVSECQLKKYCSLLKKKTWVGLAKRDAHENLSRARAIKPIKHSKEKYPSY